MSFEDELPDVERVQESINRLLDRLDDVTQQKVIELVNAILLDRER